MRRERWKVEAERRCHPCLNYISDEVTVVMKSPSGDRQHKKEVKAHEKSLSQLCKQNKLGEEDELKKGDLELEEEEEDNIDIDGEHNKEEYYEVEAIRKKRNHNGQLQYLIKWFLLFYVI